MTHGPAGAADQRGLDEIVAEDVAAEGRLARQMTGRPAASVKAGVRMMALWPQ